MLNKLLINPTYPTFPNQPSEPDAHLSVYGKTYIEGNVGIGTTSPTQKLDVRGNMRLGDGSSSEQDIEYKSQGGDFQVGLNGTGSAHRFYIWSSNGSYGTYNISVLRSNSYVGIGTHTASYKLDVHGNAGNTGYRNLRYFNVNQGFGYANTYFGDTVARFNGSIWGTSWIGSSSDSRIKKDIQDLDDNEMLNKLMLIEPKKYKYKDKLKPDTEVYGFIAQQVRKVIGDFGVDLKPEYIYDINDTATITSNIITSEYDLELSSNYKIHTFDGEEKEIVIENILGNNQYEISGYEYSNLDTSNIDTSNMYQDIHIQGKKVDDFHILNKNAIFTMNVGATQELYKIIQQQQQTIDSLTQRIEHLENI